MNVPRPFRRLLEAANGTSIRAIVAMFIIVTPLALCIAGVVGLVLLCFVTHWALGSAVVLALLVALYRFAVGGDE